MVMDATKLYTDKGEMNDAASAGVVMYGAKRQPPSYRSPSSRTSGAKPRGALASPLPCSTQPHKTFAWHPMFVWLGPRGPLIPG